jgi:homopolymeric O-antigen transport system permease protein
MQDTLSDLFRSRALVQCLVSRELKARYRGSVLGFLWSFLNPLLLLSVYALVFRFYMRQNLPHYSLYLFSGLLPWLWFTSSLTEGAGSVVEGGNLVRRILFPAEVLPTVSVLSNLVHFAFGLPVLLGFSLLCGVKPGWSLLTLPVVVVPQLLFTEGLALFLAAVTVHFRDVRQALSSLLTFWFFLCPIIYTMDLVQRSLPERLSWLLWAYRLNPVVHLVQGYQAIFYYGRLPDPLSLSLATLIGAAAFLVGSIVFRRLSDAFPELV